MRHVSGPVTPRPGKNAYLLPVLAAAAAVGMSYDEVIVEILTSATTRV